MLQSFNQYWTLLKLSSNGGYQSVPQLQAQQFFQAQFPAAAKPTLDDDRIQPQLLSLPQPEAQLCLRCYISHAIVHACDRLVRQFGTLHGFQLSELLPLVLDDDATVGITSYQPLSLRLLQTFQPNASSLAAWTTRQVRQHPDVKQFLMEHGVYLISPWALLNDTKPDRLPSILTQFHHLTDAEVTQASLLLESYRRVYLPDRLQQRLQQGDRKACSSPTPAQLQQMSQVLQESTQLIIAPEAVLKQLQTLAQQIRQYRIARRGGVQRSQSLDDPILRERIEYELIDNSTVDFDSTDHTEFLQRYRHSFQTCLETAIAIVIQDRVQKSPKQSERFLIALEAYYCQHLSMGEIAPKIKARAQDAVSRLLNLKPLRADVRHQMLTQLKATVITQAAEFMNPDQLRDCDRQIQVALDQQLEALMQAETQRDKTPKGFKKGETHFSQSLCRHLDRLLAQLPTPSNPS
jgi:hypothetical protein